MAIVGQQFPSLVIAWFWTIGAGFLCAPLYVLSSISEARASEFLVSEWVATLILIAIPTGCAAGAGGALLGLLIGLPPDKVLAAAKTFAREKFALKHQYAMALHTHQEHPHVHLVVKAEDYHGHRLHIDKALLREWRQDFARTMQDQGIAANATPRAVRGQSKRADNAAMFWARRRGSYMDRERIKSVATELSTTGTVRDTAREKLHETRKAVVTGWMGIADSLDTQGEIVLAGDVRYFASHLAPVLTGRERLAHEFVQHLKATSVGTRGEDLVRERDAERSR